MLVKGKETKVDIAIPLKDDHDKDASKCFHGFYGHDNCDVVLSCDVTMSSSGGDDCSEEFVQVTDGSGGSKKFCGKTKFDNIRASKGLRHLFLVIESEDQKKRDGISCTAKCAEKEDEGVRLEKEEERKFDLRCMCGLQNKDDRIVGGEDAKENEFPWQAAVVYPKTRSPNCGASVINDRFVLTAAHCFWFDDKKPDDLEILVHATLLDMTKKKGAKDVKLGKEGSIRSSGYKEDKKTDEDEKTQRFKVLEIINHPLFNDQYDYDYALLRLDRKIDLSAGDSPTPICLPDADMFDKLLADWVGKNLTVTGWGLADELAGGTTRALQKLDVPLMPYSKCTDSNQEMVTKRMICAGYEDGKKDACTGDSGGPLIKKSEDSKQWTQVGIVSWGEGCARAGKPGMYSRITEMVQWIHLHTSDQGSKWCQEKK
jgi:hypothetical protein